MGVELTYQDVAEHNTKKDIFMVIHDKIYDCTKFVDEHPPFSTSQPELTFVFVHSGGEEVLLDVGGQDATEAFEDVGHSDEARETLEQLLIGELKRQPGDPAPKKQTPAASSASNTESPGFGIGLYAVLLIGGVLAYVAYQYQQQQQQTSA
ncbi:cytochrome b5 [Colletotrichum tofieldiae]|nr:cytochrome b5 [Colletotrichum tofieldiae]GKT77232.1 cytochrome b5 [Colletotrichum tofieldiae]GKT86378.1 cytochrome B5 [Colletotrichum tofieldiae]